MNSLVLRQWRDSDLGPFFEMSSDPEVMRHFPSTMTEQETAAAMARLKKGIEEKGWGVWAVEVDGEFAGLTGLLVPRFAAPCMPCTEILWRLRRQFWGRGVAYAAAVQALDYGFSTLRLTEIVAFTASSNLRSMRLMDRLGFVRDLEGDFEHPIIPQGHPLRLHFLYRKRSGPSAKSAR